MKSNFVETEEELLLMAYIDRRAPQTGDKWYLDSGCSNRYSLNSMKILEKL